jgi:membrane protein
MESKKQSISNKVLVLLGCLRPALKLFRKNDPLRMAGATAFFTTFALPPIIFILAQLFGLFVGRRNMGRGLVQNLSEVLGKDGAEQVRQVLRSIRGLSDKWYVFILGFLFLVFVATTLFNVIKDSLNQIWQISIRERPGILFMLRSRLRSFVVILFVGILFFADLFFHSVELLAGKYMNAIWMGSGVYFESVFSRVASVGIVSAWFIILFRFLADGRPGWRAAITGGLLSGVLFSAGALILRELLVNSNISLLYGAAASFVLILLFVFYSSFILYYGACFIAILSERMQWPFSFNNKAYRGER